MARTRTDKVEVAVKSDSDVHGSQVKDLHGLNGHARGFAVGLLHPLRLPGVEDEVLQQARPFGVAKVVGQIQAL